MQHSFICTDSFAALLLVNVSIPCST